MEDLGDQDKSGGCHRNPWRKRVIIRAAFLHPYQQVAVYALKPQSSHESSLSFACSVIHKPKAISGFKHAQQAGANGQWPTTNKTTNVQQPTIQQPTAAVAATLKYKEE
jgi:hypothetical protein